MTTPSLRFIEKNKELAKAIQEFPEKIKAARIDLGNLARNHAVSDDLMERRMAEYGPQMMEELNVLGDIISQITGGKKRRRTNEQISKDEEKVKVLEEEKLTLIEANQGFSEKINELVSSHEEFKTENELLKTKFSGLENENKVLKTTNSGLDQEIVDIKEKNIKETTPPSPKKAKSK